MFIGRERELASLKEFYDKDGVILYDAEWNWNDGDIWTQTHWKVYAYC